MKEKEKSRTRNSIYNISASLIEYIVKIITTFVIRTIFIRILGSEFLGLDGLFTSILSMLSVTELGLGGAIVFGLYKPLLNKDTEKINILIHVYKKCYMVIGGVILAVGFLMMPFLPQIVNSDYNFGNIYVLFLLYLLQTVSTYWILGYKEVLFTADQKKHKIVVIANAITILKFILQAASLLWLKSFEFYIISGLIMTVARNLLIAAKVDKSYPYAKRHNGKKLSKSDRVDLTKNVFGMSLYKISSKVMNSTDNIVISMFVSLAATGIYSNYLLIVSNIKTVLDLIFSSVTASAGNLYAEGRHEKSEFIFRCLNFMNFWIYGFVAICFWELLNPFITIWLGEEYIFETVVVLLIVMNFVTDGLQRAVLMYKDACGLFWRGKLRPVFSAGLNIIISVILVQFMGISGVILGSIISRMLSTWWFDPYLVYKHGFGMSSRGYYFRYVRSLLIIIMTALIIDGIMKLVNLDFAAMTVVRTALSIMIPNLVFWFCSRKSEEYIYIKGILSNWISRKRHHKD